MSRFDLERVVPSAEWLREYDTGWFRTDLVAGLTVGAAVVPEGMAYAALAGLPLETGLYASLAAVTVYLFLGSSRQVIVGPTSALSILLATQVGAIAATGPSTYVTLVGVTTLLVGLIALLAWLFRLGFVMNFISGSVVTGFSAGAALFIISTQLPKLLGLGSSTGPFYERVWDVLTAVSAVEPTTAILGIGTVLVLLVGEQVAPRSPSALIVVVLSIVLVNATSIERRGVAVVGSIPSGVPAITLPTAPLSVASQLLPVALALFVLSYVEGMAAVETFAQRHKDRVDANQELLATGVANVAAGLAQGFVVGGSMSRSALNDAVGGQSQAVNAVVALVILTVLVLFTGVLSALPETTLAAIVIVAVTNLIDVSGLRRLWRVDRWEFLTAAVALTSVLVVGLLYGVFLGVLISVIVVLGRVTYPHTAELGRTVTGDEFTDIARHPSNERVPGVLVYRVDAELFFANAPTVRDDLLERLDERDDQVRLVVFDMRSSPTVDLTAAEMLGALHERLAHRGINLRLAEADGAVQDVLARADSAHPLCETPVNESVAATIESWQRQQEQ